MQFLLFDENPVLLKVVGGELVRLGYEVHRTKSAERALELLREHAIDVAVLDADAGDDAALEIVETIRSNPSTVGLPILFLSMATEAEVTQRFSKYDHFACLTKPIRVAHLCEKIESLVWQDRSAAPTDAPAVSSSGLDALAPLEVASPPRRRRPAVRPARRVTRGYIDDPQRGAMAPPSLVIESDVSHSPLNDFVQRAARLFYPGAIDVFELMTDPKRSIADYSAVVSKHPALQNAILARVNSADFGLRRKVVSISEACALMGLRDLCATCLHDAKVDEHAFVTRVWRQSIIAGFIARRLAEHLCPELVREAALGAMLHSLGVVAFLLVPHPAYERVLTRTRETEQSLVDAELELIGFHHCELGSLLVPKLGARDSVAAIVHDGVDPKEVVNAASWCAFVACSATQLRLKTLRRRVDPTADLQLLARRFPAYWKQTGTLLPTFFGEVESFQEVFNS